MAASRCAPRVGGSLRSVRSASALGRCVAHGRARTPARGLCRGRWLRVSARCLSWLGRVCGGGSVGAGAARGFTLAGAGCFPLRVWAPPFFRLRLRPSPAALLRGSGRGVGCRLRVLAGSSPLVGLSLRGGPGPFTRLRLLPPRARRSLSSRVYSHASTSSRCGFFWHGLAVAGSRRVWVFADGGPSAAHHSTCSAAACLASSRLASYIVFTVVGRHPPLSRAQGRQVTLRSSRRACTVRHVTACACVGRRIVCSVGAISPVAHICLRLFGLSALLYVTAPRRGHAIDASTAPRLNSAHTRALRRGKDGISARTRRVRRRSGLGAHVTGTIS